MEHAIVEGVARVEAGRLSVVPDDTVAAFRSLTASSLDRAYRLAWAILGDDAEAQDATQDAFTAAWRQRGTLREPERIEAWFTRILVNTCRDRLRRRARNRIQPLELAPLPSIADASEPASNRDELGRALGALDPDHRIVVVLRFWADLTVDDIAERLGIPAGTVKSRLHKAMRTLRSCLEDAR